MLERSKELWEENCALLLEEPTRENAKKIMENFEEMAPTLKAPKSLKTKKSFAALRKTGDLCLRPLTLANYYLMKSYEVAGLNYERKMQDGIERFYKDLDILKNHPANTPEIEKLLQKAEKDFLFFKMMYRSKVALIPTLIGQKADDIFDTIRQIKKLYASLNKNI